jgi:DNA-binding MarR family transcriptional regulator
MWDALGFSRNLYDTHPVRGDAEGERLLVGREDELRRIKTRITGFNNVVTIEGANGVGKTSLILVAGFQLERDTANQGKRSTILMREPLQLSVEESAQDFKRKVYAAIASQFIANEQEYRRRLDLQFNLNPLTAWLEHPLVNNGQINLGPIGGGFGRSVNDGSGFDAHGFFNIVDRLLAAAFVPSGGIVCIVDNLEILNTSQAARQKLEELRDELFSRHGIKWVVCGARGIVRSVAASPRLHGRLAEPLEISPLDANSIQDLISSRVNEYSLRSGSIPPVGAASLTYVFEILNKNLRDALKFAGDFSLWTVDNGSYTPNEAELDRLFEIWLAEQSDRYSSAINVPQRAWQLLDEFCKRGGAVSPSDYEEFGFNSPQNMRGHVAKLENAELVTSELDETDHRRKTINVMAKGWLLQHQRSGYLLPKGA